MFAVIYRWQVVPGLEAQFEQGWSRGTERIAASRTRAVRLTSQLGAVLGAANKESGSDSSTASTVPAIDIASVSSSGRSQ